MRQRRRVCVALLAGVLGVSTALAAEAPGGVRPPSPLALSCALCHGSDAAVPALDALSADALAQRLRAFRDGTRGGVAMPRLVRGLDDATLDALARDVAALRPPASRP